MGIYVLLLIVFIFILCLSQYNSLKKLQLKAFQAKSALDVYYQQRFDIIPNLVEVVKEYKKYEENLFVNITELRNKYYQTKEITVGEELDRKLNEIMITIEAYPELKASEQFSKLQKNLVKVENQIQAARRIYNNDVTRYNIKISIIPYNIIAKLFGFKAEPLFEVESSNARDNVKVSKF